MSIRINLLVLAALLLLVAAATFVGTYYRVDRTGLIEGACELGLPNLTLPRGFAEGEFGDRFDCPVFGAKKRYFGYVTDVGGLLRFSGNEMATNGSERSSTQVDALLLCEEDDCGSLLERELSQHVLESCNPEIRQLRFAGAIIEGSVSSNSFYHGHMGVAHDPIFYAAKVEEAFQPLKGGVEWWARRDADSGLCDDKGV